MEIFFIILKCVIAALITHFAFRFFLLFNTCIKLWVYGFNNDLEYDWWWNKEKYSAEYIKHHQDSALPTKTKSTIFIWSSIHTLILCIYIAIYVL